MLKKLRDALEYMRGRMDGQNKEDVEKAISMVVTCSLNLISLLFISILLDDSETKD